MIRKLIECLFISTLLISIWSCKKEPTCGEVVHIAKVPVFSAEQELIISKYRSIIHAKLLHPDMYYIYSVEMMPNGNYGFRLNPLKVLQSYEQIRNDGNLCGGVMSIGADVWLIIDKSGKIIKTNEYMHIPSPFIP